MFLVKVPISPGQRTGPWKNTGETFCRIGNCLNVFVAYFKCICCLFAIFVHADCVKVALHTAVGLAQTSQALLDSSAAFSK